MLYSGVINAVQRFEDMDHHTGGLDINGICHPLNWVQIQPLKSYIMFIILDKPE